MRMIIDVLVSHHNVVVENNSDENFQLGEPFGNKRAHDRQRNLC